MIPAQREFVLVQLSKFRFRFEGNILRLVAQLLR